jgi:hypothetical protein
MRAIYGHGNDNAHFLPYMIGLRTLFTLQRTGSS